MLRGFVLSLGMVAFAWWGLWVGAAEEGELKPKKEPAPEAEKPAQAEKPAEEPPVQQLGEYVWGPRISRADLEGRVLVCVAFSAEDRTAPQIPNMIAGQLKDPRANSAVVMLLLEKEKLSRALRLASAVKLSFPIVVGAKIADLKVERDKKGKPETTILIRTPDGATVFSGRPDRGNAQSLVDQVKKAVQRFPSCITGGRQFEKSAAILRQLNTATSYSSIVNTLKLKTKSKDATEASEARSLLLHIEAYGGRLLEKGAYFENVHVPTAQETYAAISKAFKGLEAGAKADERLKAIKADKKTTKEVAAAKLADAIRLQCALLGPAPGAEVVDLSNPACSQAPFNKKVVGKLLQDISGFKAKYRETKIAKECLDLISAYGVKDSGK